MSKKELVVKKSITINATASKIWEALTKSEWTRKYMFGCDVVSDWKSGDAIVFKDSSGVVQVKGNIVNIAPGKLLKFTVFGPTMGLQDVPSNYTTVTYELSPGKGHTIVSVAQGDFAGVEQGEKRYNETGGGWDFALNKLKEALEQ